MQPTEPPKERQPSASGPASHPQPKRSKFSALLVSTFLLSLCVALQAFSGSYQTEFADDSDEAAHFVTGVMVYDYLATSIGQPPFEFAKDFYCHYPKVAFGHWPPVFYCVQACWFFLFGVSPVSAMSLVGMSTAGISIVLFWRLQPVYGIPIALSASVFVLAIPLVQKVTTVFLSESLVSLFCLLAAFSFADFLRSNHLKHSLLFSAWATLAILTKGNALMLMFLPMFGILFARQFQILKSWKLWLSGVLVGVMTFPCYYFFFDAMTNVSSGDGLSQNYYVRNIFLVPTRFPSILGIVPFGMMLLGGTSVIFDSSQDLHSIRRSYVGISNAMFCACVLFMVLSPIADTYRYFLPAIVVLAINFAEFNFLVMQNLRKQMGGRAIAVPLLVTAIIVFAYPKHVRPHFSGYAKSIVGLTDGQDHMTALLVSADAQGEGAIVAAQRLVDDSSRNVVVRSSKLLASESWMGMRYQLKYEELNQVEELLKTMPVHFIVMENYEKFEQEEPPHHSLLRQVIQRSPETFPLLRNVNAYKGKREISDAIQVYENIAARGIAPSRIEIDLGYSLGGSINTVFD